MRQAKLVVLVALSVVVLLMTGGCGSSSTSAGFSPSPGGGTGGSGGGSSLGTITFITQQVASDPDGTLFTLDYTVDAAFAFTTWTFPQQMPFIVKNPAGAPMPGVSVTLSKYSQVSGAATFTPPLTQTVVTDAFGRGIFNLGVSLVAPAPGGENGDSVVYKAYLTNSPTVYTYAGFVVHLFTQNGNGLSISPATLAFSASDVAGATRLLTVAGGSPPYAVTSSDPTKVSVALSGSTITATLVDATSWTGTVTVTVTDSASDQVSATISRQ